MTDSAVVRVRCWCQLSTEQGTTPYQWDVGGRRILKVADDYKKILGDGKARLSLTMDMGSKDFGNGFSAGVTVTLTHDQSEGGFEDAFEAALDLQEGFLQEAAEFAQEKYDAWVKSTK